MSELKLRTDITGGKNTSVRGLQVIVHNHTLFVVANIDRIQIQVICVGSSTHRNEQFVDDDFGGLTASLDLDAYRTIFGLSVLHVAAAEHQPHASAFNLTGNDGPRVSTVQSPGSYPDVITVGASDSEDAVANFSGRGPSPWGEVKPEVVAPGAEIRSSLPGGTYGQAKGTSMATPHVSGLVALLLQADPTLTVDGVEALITSTAIPLDQLVPNSNSGWGRVDAYQAVAVAMEAGFIAGQVTAQPDREPVPSAQITASDEQGEYKATVLADDTGRYLVAVPPGRYRLEVNSFGYGPQTGMKFR